MFKRADVNDVYSILVASAPSRIKYRRYSILHPESYINDFKGCMFNRADVNDVYSILGQRAISHKI